MPPTEGRGASYPFCGGSPHDDLCPGSRCSAPQLAPTDSDREPDEGIWEVRGPRQHFTHSKVMAWVAMDRAVRIGERVGVNGLGRWRSIAAEIHREVCNQGYDPEANTLVQYYGSKGLDASLLQLPVLGFLPANDPRVIGTIAAIERQLASGPLVARYSTEEGVDGLPPGEGAFLLCSFWLVDALVLAGQVERARQHFEELLALRNDVGLLSEEYEPRTGRFLGNFPQAFSHIGLINSAHHLCQALGLGHRAKQSGAGEEQVGA
jgi:GH15 family glucan-1,4-alpha-glucosidase